MIKKSMLIGTVLSTLVVLTGCQSLGSEVELTKSLSYKNVEEIVVDVSSAEVSIIKDNRNDIFVEFDTYENGDELRTSEGSKTTIETYSNKNINIQGNTDYKLRIYIPEDFKGDMTFDLSSGSVNLSDFELANVSFELSSGNLNISDISTNEIKLDLSSGDVTFNNVSTSLLDLEISSGDVDLVDFSGKVKGDASSGSFSVRYKEEMDDLSFEASSGNINIDYRNVDVNGDFKLTKSSGDFDVNLDLENYRESNDGDKITGSSGNGEHTIDLNISSGNIDIY